MSRWNQSIYYYCELRFCILSDRCLSIGGIFANLASQHFWEGKWGEPKEEIGNLNGFEYVYLSDLKIPYFCTHPLYQLKLFSWARQARSWGGGGHTRMGFWGGCEEEKGNRGQCNGAGGWGGYGNLQRCCFVVGVLLHTQELNIKTTHA